MTRFNFPALFRLDDHRKCRTKPGVIVPEWDGAKVTLREPSGDAWV
ncbi:phage tail assembly chaperone, partial [Escherichia sp. SP-MK]